MKNYGKMKIISSFYIILIFTFSCNSQHKSIEHSNKSLPQKEVYSIKCCMDSVINSITNNETLFFKKSGIKIEVEKTSIALYEGQIKERFDNNVIQSWLEVADKDSIKVYELVINTDHKYYLLYSRSKETAGLYINIMQWLIIGTGKNFAFNFHSLLNDPRFFYYKRGNINPISCVTFDYSLDFDFDDPYFKITNYNIKEGEIKKIKEVVSHCPCNK